MVCKHECKQRSSKPCINEDLYGLPGGGMKISVNIVLMWKLENSSPNLITLPAPLLTQLGRMGECWCWMSWRWFHLNLQPPRLRNNITATQLSQLYALWLQHSFRVDTTFDISSLLSPAQPSPAQHGPAPPSPAQHGRAASISQLKMQMCVPSN